MDQGSQVVKKKRPTGMSSECDHCLYSDSCPKAFAGSKCRLVSRSEISLDSPADVLEAQKAILIDTMRTLKKAEALARMGIVSFSDVDRVRRMVLEFSEKLKKSMVDKKTPKSASEKLGIGNGASKS